MQSWMNCKEMAVNWTDKEKKHIEFHYFREAEKMICSISKEENPIQTLKSTLIKLLY